MPIVKKLIFAPFFLTSFIILLSQLPSIFKSYDFIFSLSADTLIQLVTVSLLITLASLSFILFASLALEWRIILPVGILASLFPFVFIEPAQGVVFMTGIIISLLIFYITLEKQMKSYLSFNPNSILGPPIRHLSTLLIIIISIVYFLSVNQIVSEKGFQIPDSLIDTSLKLIPQPQNDQSQKLPQDLSTETVKQTVKDQLQTIIKPYHTIIPAVLAVLLFFILLSFASILNLLIYPLLWIIFYVLEQTGYISYTTEQRPVKKMAV